MDGTASQEVGDCEDLMQEILINLPAKVLARFKCVSKRWLKRINSLEFSTRHYFCSISKKQHQQHSRAILLLLVRCLISKKPIITISISSTSIIHYENERLPVSKSVTYHWEAPPMFSLGFGLFCIFNLGSLQEVSLWNPTTKEIKGLPSSPFPDPDPDPGTYLFGFGHAEVIKDISDSDKLQLLSYKVGILSAQENSPVTLRLYSSTTDSWKLLTSDVVRYERNSYADGVNCKGIFHLLSDPFKASPYIITFDYATEAFGTMEMPDLSYNTLFLYFLPRSRLTLYGDTLCLFLCRLDEKLLENHKDQFFYDVWVMRDYGVKESWFKEFTVGPFNGKTRILGYWRSLGGILLNEYANWWSRLYLYKCASRELVELSVGSASIDLEDIYPYEHVESLVSINGSSFR